MVRIKGMSSATTIAFEERCILFSNVPNYGFWLYMEYREIKLGVKTGSKIIIVLLLTDIIIESRIIKSLLSFPHTKNASGFSEAFFF